MIGMNFEALTRRTADLVSRRASLLALSGVALGGLASPSLVEAKKGKSCQKKVDKTCKKQQNTCEASVEAFCELHPEPAFCQQDCRPCCESLAQCRAAESTDCLLRCGAA
jgi:hypothetical protein